MLEILLTISIFFIFLFGILKVRENYRVRDKQILARAELVTLADALERYFNIFGDYPKIASHDDQQGDVLYSALHGQIDPDGNSVSDGQDFVETNIKEIDGRFVDPFLSDYIYYYKMRGSESLWRNPSYILISKGPKGQQNPERSVVVSKSVTVTMAGVIIGDAKDDIIVTSGGIL